MHDKPILAILIYWLRFSDQLINDGSFIKIAVLVLFYSTVFNLSLAKNGEVAVIICNV